MQRDVSVEEFDLQEYLLTIKCLVVAVICDTLMKVQVK